MSNLWRLIQRLKPKKDGGATAKPTGLDIELNDEDDTPSDYEKKARFPGLSKSDTVPIEMPEPDEVLLVIVCCVV